jgi:hypothetical protein
VAEADHDDKELEIRLRWGAIAAGVITSYLLAVALGFGLARAGLADGVAWLPLAQFLALFAGGLLAGRLAGTSGFMNGAAVAVAFIVVWAAGSALYEAWLVREYGPLVLPRMNIGGIILGDVLNLSAAAFGGWLGHKAQKAQKPEKSETAQRTPRAQQLERHRGKAS